MAKSFLAVCVYVDDLVEMAESYQRRLGMRVEVVGVDGERPRIVVLAGAAGPPFAALVARTDDHARSLEPPGIPRGPGLRRVVVATDTFDTDAADFVTWAGASPCTDGRGAERIVSAAVSDLGLWVDLVEERPEATVASVLALAWRVAGHGLAWTESGAALAQLRSRAAAEMTVAPLDHMAVGVVDPARALDAAKRVLGCETYDDFTLAHASGSARIRLVSPSPPDGFSLAIGDSQAPEHPFVRQIAERGGPGVHHLAHRVPDLEAALEATRAAGGTALSPIEEAPGLRQLFVSVGQEGLVHELIQRTGVSGFVTRNTSGLIRAEGDWSSSTGGAKDTRGGTS